MVPLGTVDFLLSGTWDAGIQLWCSGLLPGFLCDKNNTRSLRNDAGSINKVENDTINS
jgi:hypothetical protein